MAAAAPDEAIIGRTVGNYRVARLLGAGGMGSVYLLSHVRLPNTFAALKVLKSPGGVHAAAVKERFVQEAIVAAAIGGDRVARPLDLGRFDDDTPYIIMEFVDGQTLSAVLEATPALPLVAALKIAWRVAETIAIAHARNIVHRDLKPSNIMLVGRRDDAHIKVLDFGVARAAGEFKVAQTLESAVIGSPGYMSPEAASGSTVDGRTDVFSLGCTLFKMLTGELPFPATRAREGLVALLTQPAPLPSQKRPAALDRLPPSVDALMASALAKDPGERATMAELRDRLLEILREVAPVEATALLARHEAASSPSAPSDIDQLGSTLSPDSPDLGKLRAQVEQFAATRVPSSLPPRATVRKRALLIAAAVVVVATTALTAWRMQRRTTATAAATTASTTPAARTEPTPLPVRDRQRQITFTGVAGSSAIARDGKSIAYADREHIYIYDPVSDDRREVGPSAGLSRLVWSVDGGTLYAARGWHLEKVARDGNAHLSPIDDFGGYVAFSPDGKEVANCFQPTRFIDFRATASKARLRHVELHGKFTFIEGLDWSPRGNWLMLMTVQGAKQTLWLISPDGKIERPVVTDAISEAHFAAHGEGIFYLRDESETRSALLFVPLTADGNAGAARVVVPSIATGEFSLTGDGKQLLYPRSESQSNLWLVRGRGGPPRALTNDTAPKGMPALSPDGKQIVFTVDDGAGSDVYSMGLDGGARQRLTRGEQAVNPVWSPDGRRVAYRRSAGPELVIVDARSGAELARNVLPDPSASRELTWAPGARILFHAEGNRALRAFDPATRQIAPIAADGPGWMFNGVYSPDGATVAAYWNASPTAGTYLIDPVARTTRLLRAGHVVPLGWSADGKSVLILPAEPASGGRFDIEQLPTSGAAARRWMTMPFSQSECACRPDAAHGLAVCDVSVWRSDLVLIENLDELVAAAR